MVSEPDLKFPHLQEIDMPSAVMEAAPCDAGSGHLLQHYVLCRDLKRVAEWELRRSELPGVQLHLCSGFASMYAFIAHAIDDCPADQVVVSHDDVVMGFNFDARVEALVSELESRFPNWGIAGNAGIVSMARVIGSTSRTPGARR
jgi:hypothetical protein